MCVCVSVCDIMSCLTGLVPNFALNLPGEYSMRWHVVCFSFSIHSIFRYTLLICYMYSYVQSILHHLHPPHTFTLCELNKLVVKLFK